ncbi:prolyl oligopeptidase family serine peptidase [Oxalobacteraceae bacterium A2-2]
MKLRTSLLPVLLALALHALPGAAQTSSYQLPPPALQALVDAPRTPSLLLSPQRNLAAMRSLPGLPGIAEVAQPELKLAGIRINPRTYAASEFTFGNGLVLLDLDNQKEIAIAGLPSALRVAHQAWSPDQRYLAFSHIAYGAQGGAVELWLVDVAGHTARKLTQQPLNAVLGNGFRWLPDSRGLLVTLRPAGQGPAPVASAIPTGPNTQQTQAGAAERRLPTYADLLKTEADAALFEHYITSQVAIVDLQGKVRTIGKPSQYAQVSVSPDGKLLLAHTVLRPYSYLVPYSLFGQRTEVLDLNGKVVHTVATRTLREGMPPGEDATTEGPRSVAWRADAPATLSWVEAQDGGHPGRKVDVRDIVYQQAAPFTAAPQALARLGTRYDGILWGTGDLAIVKERSRKTGMQRSWRIAPDAPDHKPEQLWSGLAEDRYHHPGTPVTRPDSNGNQRLQLVQGALLLDGEGASPEGDRPFLDRYDLASKKSERLFQSAAPYYENVVAVLNDDGSRILTTRETPTERANYYVRDLRQPADRQLAAVTRFPHPTPQLKDIQKEQIRYKRADGVALTATLLLPPGYDAKRDGPLPLLMWAYPREYKSDDTAGQVSGSPYKFNAVSYWGPAPFLAMGYAVMDAVSFPIVGKNGAQPNDTYLPQLIADAEAAINEAVKRGVADREHIAIGGHSYGAFMTANLLAHTRLFKAGIARSGAYNRSLTPFGFQSEERTYWKAPEVYQAMAPFNSADKIKDALLMIHGEQDNNQGTFPIQSERMYAAIKGLGGTARLVMLPNEAHAYRARESIMHMLYETNQWLDKYVKNAPAAAAGTH